jgi:hypothetical protein
VWNFARPDSDVQAAAAHGVQILAILQTVPGWAASPADPDLAAAKPVPVHFTLPKSYARWGDYVRTRSEEVV